MKTQKKIFQMCVVLAAFFGVLTACAAPVHAQTTSQETSTEGGVTSGFDLPTSGAGGEIKRNLTIFGFLAGLPDTDLGTFFGRLVRLAIGFIGIILVLLIIYSGLVWMTSGGDEEKVAKAKKTLINAVVGLIIIFSANSIVTFLINQLTAPESSTQP